MSALLCVVSARCLEILDNLFVSWEDVSTRTFLSFLFRKKFCCSSDTESKSALDILSITQELTTFAFRKAVIVEVSWLRWFPTSAINSDFFFSLSSSSATSARRSMLDLKAAIFALPSAFNSFRNSRGPVHWCISC